MNPANCTTDQNFDAVLTEPWELNKGKNMGKFGLSDALKDLSIDDAKAQKENEDIKKTKEHRFQPAIYTVLEEESESEVRKCKILEPEQKK